MEGCLNQTDAAAPCSRARCITARINARPTAEFWAAGSTVIGPTPWIMARSSSTLLPTIRPPRSATTPYKPSVENIIDRMAVVASAFGKSGGKLCAALIALNAS